MNSVKSVSYAGKNGTVTTVPAESLDDVISTQCVGFMKRNRNKILVGVVLSVCVILSTAALVFSIGVEEFNKQDQHNYTETGQASGGITSFAALKSLDIGGDAPTPELGVKLERIEQDIQEFNHSLLNTFEQFNATIQQLQGDDSNVDSTVATCPNGLYVLNPFSGTCYRLIRQLKRWNESQAYCEAAGEHLVTFKSYQAAEWYAAAQQSQHWGQHLWIGLRNVSTTGGWPRTTTYGWRWQGIASGYQLPGIARWAPNQPNSDHPEWHCTYTNIEYWYSFHCDYHNRFVCELEI